MRADLPSTQGIPVPVPAGQRRVGRKPWGVWITAWLMVAPAMLGLALFYLWPAARAVQISFTEWNLLRPPRDIGFANYVQLWNDGRFWQGLKLSALYALMNIPLQTVLGLGLAVAMHRLARSLFVKTVVLLPYLLSNVLVAMVWLWMLDPALGAANQLIPWLGGKAQGFFSDADQALWTVALVNIWRHMGLVAMLFLAGLQNIPTSLYEAARLEGAASGRSSGASHCRCCARCWFLCWSPASPALCRFLTRLP